MVSISSRLDCTRLFLVSGVLLLVAMPATAQRMAQAFAPDAFGYTLLAADQCPQQWLDISASGQLLSLQPAGAEPADDDGAAQLTLAEAFEFYGRTYTQLMVSSNGYVGVAADANGDNGGDFSNDCPLPAVPDNGAAALGRLLPLHDDLQAGASGEVRSAYLAPCPRPGGLAGEACTVVSWSDWSYHQQPGASVAFQLLLYHQSRQVVSQYQNVAAIDSASATIGLQAPQLAGALTVDCNQPLALPSSGAWCAAYPLPVETLLSNGFE